LHPNTVTNILQDLIAQGYINRFGDSRPYVYRPTADGEQLAGNLLDKNTLPSP
jgi:Penicillinase repressor.